MTSHNPDRPLVTFALFAYNQEKYIREAVEGAFAQTYEPLEIILSDDCSSDRTFEIMRQMACKYNGPHSLTVRRNEKNEGLAVHVNTVMRIMSGQIVVMAAGDDISLPDRTEVSVSGLLSNPNVSEIILSAEVIDDSGTVVGERLSARSATGERLQTLNDLLRWEHTTFGATRALRREVFTSFGPLNGDCPTEDTPFLLRGLICGTSLLLDKKAIRYRRHERNLSSVEALKKMNLDEIYRQYSDDLDVAVKLNLINNEMEIRLKQWIRLDRKLRGLRLSLISNKIDSFEDVILAARHPAIMRREKIKFLITYLDACAMGAKRTLSARLCR